MQPQFSICHATARLPSGWRASRNAWVEGSAYPHDVEYILSMHERDRGKLDVLDQLKVIQVYQHNRYCSVDNWNAAAAASTGQVIVLNADDFFPPRNWDLLLMESICKAGLNLDDEFVVHVSTGSPRDAELISLGILSRKVYRRWGYALWPEYESMNSDDDFTERAKQEGIVVEARNLMFEHAHPSLTEKTTWDRIYSWQSRREAHELGERIFERRRENHFSR